MEVFMKNELILSSLILTAQIAPNALATEAIQKELNQGVQETIIKTPLIKINHPFKERDVLEVYAEVSIRKDNSTMNDMNLGLVTHNISFKFFDRNGKEIKDFEVIESEEGGFYAELRGVQKDSKAYILWSCSSTMNCGFDAPGFLHVYEQENNLTPFYYTIDLPVFTFTEKEEIRYERIHFNFEMAKKLIK